MNGMYENRMRFQIQRISKAKWLRQIPANKSTQSKPTIHLMISMSPILSFCFALSPLNYH
jgi:hypothetical protein